MCGDCARFSAGEKQRDSLVASVLPHSRLHLGSQRVQGLIGIDADQVNPWGRARQQKVGREQRMHGAHKLCPKVFGVSPMHYN